MLMFWYVDLILVATWLYVSYIAVASTLSRKQMFRIIQFYFYLYRFKELCLI